MSNNDDVFLPEQPDPVPTSPHPNPFFQLIKGLAYCLLFLMTNVSVTFAIMIWFGIKKTAEEIAKGNRLSPDELSEYLTRVINERSNYQLIIYGTLLLLILTLIFVIRKKNVFQETRIKLFPVRFLPGILLTSAGIILFFNSVLTLLPSSLTASYRTDSSFMGMGSFVASFVAQALFAPLLEEITFRGLMLTRFEKGLPKWLGILISSLFFGLVHGNLLWACYAFVLGILLCVIADRADSILAPFLSHFMLNAFATICSYHNIGFDPRLLYVFTAAGFVLIILGFFLLFRKQEISPCQ